MLQLDVQSLALLAGTAVPGLVGVVAKANAERWFKVAVNAFFSVAVAAGVLVVAADGSVHLGDWVFQGIITWGLSELAYQRLYRPAGVAAFLRRRFPGGVGPVAVDRLSPLLLTSGPLRQESVPDPEPAPIPPVPPVVTEPLATTLPPIADEVASPAKAPAKAPVKKTAAKKAPVKKAVPRKE